MLSKKLAALAAFSLLAGSGIASAQSAQSLSLANSPVIERAGADMEDASNFELTVTAVVLGLLVIGGAAWGLSELLGSDSP